MKEKIFALKYAKETMARKDVQVGSGKKEGALEQKDRNVGWKQQ